MTCPNCGAVVTPSGNARFCSKCGTPLARTKSRPSLVAIRLLALPFVLIGRILAYPIRLRRKRVRWLTEAGSPNASISHVPGLSEGAKRVYSYLASVTLRFGSSHSKVGTIARATGLSENRARVAIRELERNHLLTHERRKTWHGRGAHAYYVKRVKRDSI